MTVPPIGSLIRAADCTVIGAVYSIDSDGHGFHVLATGTTRQPQEAAMSLPAPDPALGSAVNAEAGAARREVVALLKTGKLNLDGLFTMLDNEPGPSRPIGRMKARRAVEALPGIGPVKATAILEAAGVDGAHHLTQVGSAQRAALVAATA